MDNSLFNKYQKIFEKQKTHKSYIIYYEDQNDGLPISIGIIQSIDLSNKSEKIQEILESLEEYEWYTYSYLPDGRPTFCNVKGEMGHYINNHRNKKLKRMLE